MTDPERAGRYAPYVAKSRPRRSDTAPPSARIFRATQDTDLVGVADLAAEREQGSRAVWHAKLSDFLEQDDRALFVAKNTSSDRVYGYGLVRQFTFDPATAPDGVYLIGVVVAPSERRRGVGILLTLARITWAFERSDTVWYFANRQNRPSIELHRSLGFVESPKAFQIPGVSFDGGPHNGALFELSRENLVTT